MYLKVVSSTFAKKKSWHTNSHPTCFIIGEHTPPCPICLQPVIDKQTLEEYLQVEKDLGEARRADPQVLSQLEMKTEALQKMARKVERLERHYADLEAQA